MLNAVNRFQQNYTPEPLDYTKTEIRGIFKPTMKQSDRKFDWKQDSTMSILRKIDMSDNQPGVLSEFLGEQYFLYDAHKESGQFNGRSGEIIGQRDGAILVKTIDGAIWIGHLKTNVKNGSDIKLKADMVLGDKIKGITHFVISISESRGGSPAYRPEKS